MIQIEFARSRTIDTTLSENEVFDEVNITVYKKRDKKLIIQL